MSTGVVWFRRDLRIHDHPAWAAAVTRHAQVVPVFVRDPAFDGTGPFRRGAVDAAVDALGAKLGAGAAALQVLHGEPATVLPQLVRSAAADAVWCTADVTPFGRRREAAVAAALDVALHTEPGQYVQPPGSITTAAGTVPRVFSAFWRRWREALESPSETGPARPTGDPIAAAVDAFLAGVVAYETDRDLPAVRGTSELSIHLKTGALGPTELVRAALCHQRSTGADVGPFVRQLAWRDWYGHLVAETPGLVRHAQDRRYDDIGWRNDAEEIDAWREGRTGFPIVDAGMRQLLATGWMHNRVRMVVASFLVKDLLVDWRIGERWFRYWLADADVPQNVGNWQWVAGTGPDAAPYFRVFNPTRQSRRFDPAGEYLRRWLPELAGLDDRSIHEPATLGPLALAAAGVTLGVDYPAPIVDHAAASAATVAAYRKAREVQG